MSNRYPRRGDWGGGEVTQGNFGRGEPLQKPSNPDTVKKKIVHFTTLFKSQELFSWP